MKAQVGQHNAQLSSPRLTLRSSFLPAVSGSDTIANVIYGLTVQQVGRFFEFRCPQCASQGDLRPLILERSGVVKIYCQTHLDNFGVWASAADMQREKLALAKRIGLLTE